MTDEVRHEPERSRYVLERDGNRIGLADYRLADGVMRITHTEVDPALQGQGLAGFLVKEMLDDVRANSDARVVPVCPYVVTWLERHPDYQDLTSR